MRKLILQMQMTLDGYVAGPKGELDWMVWNWDEKLTSYVSKLTERIDTILLGRKMVDGFISHWSEVITQPDNPDYKSGKIFVDTPKIVFTRSMKKSIWPNTTVATGDYIETIHKLKELRGKEIIVYGGATFVSSLIGAGLIDEYHLFINPIAIGKGMTIFKDLDTKHKLSLVRSIGFDCGIVLINYIPAN
ncbi:MAG: dihydrofolate reductase [Candidatus Lokiarchaeota archaeon]|nr:dihydrofolate reductase [Candidatus Lokiarchaeota archaeon]